MATVYGRPSPTSPRSRIACRAGKTSCHLPRLPALVILRMSADACLAVDFSTSISSAVLVSLLFFAGFGNCSRFAASLCFTVEDFVVPPRARRSAVVEVGTLLSWKWIERHHRGGEGRGMGIGGSVEALSAKNTYVCDKILWTILTKVFQVFVWVSECARWMMAHRTEISPVFYSCFTCQYLKRSRR